MFCGTHRTADVRSITSFHEDNTHMPTYYVSIPGAEWRLTISAHNSIAQIPLVASRHDTTRHAFWHRKKSWRAVSRLSDSTARHARQDKCDRRDSHHICSRASPQLDWGGHAHLIFPKVVPETDANPEHERLSLYTRALLLLRRRYVRTSTARHARHVVSVASWSDATSGILA